MTTKENERKGALADTDLETVVGGLINLQGSTTSGNPGTTTVTDEPMTCGSIPETIKKMKLYMESFTYTTAEWNAYQRIVDSLKTQGLKAAKALAKRLGRDCPNVACLADMIPSG